jgi:hypothetical protein
MEEITIEFRHGRRIAWEIDALYQVRYQNYGIKPKRVVLNSQDYFYLVAFCHENGMVQKADPLDVEQFMGLEVIVAPVEKPAVCFENKDEARYIAPAPAEGEEDPDEDG